MKFAILLAFALSPLFSSAAIKKIHSFPGTIKVEVDPWDSATEVDLLFLVDDSGSMAEYQFNLANNVDAILNPLSTSGWNVHAGVITTDTYQGAGVMKSTWTSNSDANFLLQTRGNILVGTNGDAMEKHFDAIYGALSTPTMDSGRNLGFLRPSAKLMLVLLSDAEDQSQTPVEALVEQMNLIKAGTMNGIEVVGAYVTSTNASNCNRDDHNQPALRLESLVTAFNGKTIELCDPQMGPAVADSVKTAMGEVVEAADVRNIVLPMDADFKSIEVTYGDIVLEGGDVNKGWVYTRSNRTINIGAQFDFRSQPVGTKLVVSYKPTDWL